VFAVLGAIVPILLYPFVSYTHPLPQQPRIYDGFLWSIVPYIWPLAPVVPVREGDRSESIVVWAISLTMNAAIYSAVGFVLSRLGRLVAKLKPKRGPG
jgi:hypothetical protein